jgi:hypothetical protein
VRNVNDDPAVQEDAVAKINEFFVDRFDRWEAMWWLLRV